MRFLIPALALLVLGVLGWYSGYAKEAQGQLRCEGPGGVVINVDGKDYAVPSYVVRLPEPCKTAEEWLASLGDRPAQPRIAPPSDSTTPTGQATT